MVEGMLDGELLILVAVYAPNNNQAAILDTLTPALIKNLQAPSLWGGDFNCVLDPNKDRQQVLLLLLVMFGLSSESVANWQFSCKFPLLCVCVSPVCM